MKDSYFLLRLLQANRKQLKKLLGKDWPAFLRLLESTLGSFLNSRPRRGSSQDLRETVERVTRGAEEWAAVVLRDVVHGVSERKTPAGGEIEVALPDSRSVVLTVPEDIPAGKVARAVVEREAEGMMREIVGAKAAEPENTSNQGASSDEPSERYYTLSEISSRTGISMPTLQRYKKMYQNRIPAQGKGREQRYPESALPVFEELRNENAGRRGHPRKSSSAPAAKVTGRSGRTAAKTVGRGHKAGPKRAAVAAAAPAPAKNATGRKPGRPAGRRSGGDGNLLTLTQVSKQTGISYPTLVRYVRLHSDRLPSKGTGRERRFHPQAVDVFCSLRQESGRSSRRKRSDDVRQGPPHLLSAGGYRDAHIERSFNPFPTPEAPSSLAVPAEDELPPEERRINVWIAERDQYPYRPLRPQEPYNLCFQFAQPRISSLVSGPQTEIPAADIPDAGLDTEWLVVSTDVDFLPSGPEVQVSETAGSMTARFALRIPKSGDSELRKVAIRTRAVGPAQVSAVVFAVFPGGRRERYRELELTLTVSAKMQVEAVLTTEEEQVAAARHLGLRTTHEWTTPPGELAITVLGESLPVLVSGNYGGNVIGMTPLQQRWAPAAVGGCIANVRDAAETFRMKWERYLNDIDGDSLAARLQEYGQSPEYDWSQLSDRADAAHQATWDQVKTSPELRSLAAEGYTLYQEVFPKQDNPLRRWIDNLSPGAKLEISWASPTLSNIPWGLMYRQPPPRPGGEVDPTAFLGLRHRISYSTHPAAESSKALGSPASAHQASFLYWGDQANDITGVEALWQRKLWERQPNQILIPSATAANRRDELLGFWYEPSPSPISVFYLFCQCKVGNGNAPVLSFGDSLGPDLKRTDLRGADLVDRPLVFANACTTAAAEPYLASELEADFFRRGCRAFLGTETKVPIPMAARFASIFFDFFYRRVDPKPMAAGEALAQSRIFLWTRYRNIGGLFYTYINQYELFLADDAEVAALRA